MRTKNIKFAECSPAELVPVNKLALLFAGLTAFIQLLCGALSGVLTYFFNIDPFPGPEIGIALAFFSTYITAYFLLSRFRKKQGRILALSEYKRITRLGSLILIIFFLPLIFLVFFTFPDMTIPKALIFTMIAFPIATLIQWEISCFGFKSSIKMIQAKDAKIKK